MALSGPVGRTPTTRPTSRARGRADGALCAAAMKGTRRAAKKTMAFMAGSVGPGVVVSYRFRAAFVKRAGRWHLIPCFHLSNHRPLMRRLGSVRRSPVILTVWALWLALGAMPVFGQAPSDTTWDTTKPRGTTREI